MEVHLALGIGPDVISAMYPAWKLRLWRQIAEDAKSKKAFPDYHFDALGVLKSERPYHDLANWLVGNGHILLQHLTDFLIGRFDECQQIRRLCTFLGTQRERLVGALSPLQRGVGPCRAVGRPEGQVHWTSGEA